MNKKTWTAKLRCQNCAHKWEEAIPVKHKLEEAYNSTVEVEDFASVFVRRIACPNCECDTDVRKD